MKYWRCEHGWAFWASSREQQNQLIALCKLASGRSHGWGSVWYTQRIKPPTDGCPLSQSHYGVHALVISQQTLAVQAILSLGAMCLDQPG